MIVDEITSGSQFDSLQTRWDELVAQDPNASVFMTWAFLKGRFAVSDNVRWIVLGVRKDHASEYVGFLPLARYQMHKYRLQVVRELRMGGSPWADYTGFVCHPDHASEAIAALGRHVRDRMDWNRLVLRDVIDPRLDSFLDVFGDRHGFSVETSDDNVCPYLSLPASWDEYCMQFFNKKKRYNLLRSIGMVEELKEMRVANATNDDLEKLLDAHFVMYGQRRAVDRQQATLAKPIFLRCAQAGLFWCKTLWSEGVPIATAIGLLDRRAGSCMLYGTAFNDAFAPLSPGRVAVAMSIREAIDQGFRVFDFLRGDEEYKYGLGATSRKSRKAIICRRDLRSRLGLKLSKIPSLRDWIRSQQAQQPQAPGKPKS